MSPPEAASPPLFEQHADGYLLSLGLPEDWLPLIREIRSEEHLLEVVDELPEEVAERLMTLADGQLVIPPQPASQDEGQIRNHPDHARRLVVVENWQELREVLDKPLAEWLRFLHPAQRAIVAAAFNGPAKVTGGAGTGKTVVGLHRAAYLARQGHSVLVTSFVKTLCENLGRSLDLLCHPTERQRITVQNIDSLAVDLARQAHPGVVAFVDDDALVNQLQQICKRLGINDASLDFLAEEWMQVVQRHALMNWDEYRDIPRTGRGKPLTLRQRKRRWLGFGELLSRLEDQRRYPLPFLHRLAREAMEEGRITSPFDAVIVDEVQDLSSPAIRLVAALCAARPGHLMLIGDAGQRIYPGGFSLKQLGIPVVGRSHVLKINYRTTEEIRRHADGLLEGEVDDLTGGREPRRGTRSLLRGDEPVYRGFNTADAHDGYVVEQIWKLIDSGMQASDIAVFSRTGASQEALRQRVTDTGLPVSVLAKAGAEEHHEAAGVAFGTMHRAKGLEFKAVFVIGCSVRNLPHRRTMDKIHDTGVRDAFVENERRLLYVSMTRARDVVHVTWTGEPTPFLADARGAAKQGRGDHDTVTAGSDVREDHD